jgi:hypothetical protein
MTRGPSPPAPGTCEIERDRDEDGKKGVHPFWYSHSRLGEGERSRVVPSEWEFAVGRARFTVWTYTQACHLIREFSVNLGQGSERQCWHESPERRGGELDPSQPDPQRPLYSSHVADQGRRRRFGAIKRCTILAMSE